MSEERDSQFEEWMLKRFGSSARWKGAVLGEDLYECWQAARQSAGATVQQPVATLHDDGRYMWHGAKSHGFSYAGWRMKVYAAPIGDNGAKSCTCHPDDNPPVPCAQKYAYSDCVASQSTESKRVELTDDELFALIKQVYPRAVRIPPGIRAIADALLARAQAKGA